MIDKIAITTCEIDEDLEKALQIGIEWGIRNFELRTVWQKRVPRFTDEERKKLSELVKKYDVNMVGISPSVFRAGYSDEEIAESYDILEKTYMLAEELNCRNIVVFSFHRADDTTPGTIPEPAVKALRDAADTAQQKGMELLLEALPGHHGDISPHLLQVVESVKHPCFNINWDPGNVCNAGEENPYPDGYNIIKKFVRHLHLKDWLPAEGKWTILGRGCIDWVGQLAALKRDGYAGYLTIETHFSPLAENSKANYDWLKRITNYELRITN